MRLVGFEPDAGECERLNREAADTGRRFYPVALHRDRGRRRFFVTSFAAAAGFYEPDMRLWRRFPNGRSLTVASTVDHDTVDFDTFALEHDISPVDFIKADVEGAELDVLQGAEESLRKSIWGVAVEVTFGQTHVGRPVFADVDAFLGRLGFHLWDLSFVRLSRNALSPWLFAKRPGGTEHGQVMAADVLYLRDAVQEIEAHPQCGIEWDETRVLKLASFMEITGLNDCAIELVETGRQHGIVLRDDSEQLVDLLVPTTGRKAVPYRTYLERLRLKTRAYETTRMPGLRSALRRLTPRPLRPVARTVLTELLVCIHRMLGRRRG